MTRRHATAVAVAVVAMLLALAPPLWIRATGHEVTLDIAPVDPPSLLRGNYVALRYEVDDELIAGFDRYDGDDVYVLYADERPARALGVSREKPRLADGQFCLRGYLEGDLRYPALEQVFVTAERGRELERALGRMVARVAVTDGCRAVMIGLEPL